MNSKSIRQQSCSGRRRRHGWFMYVQCIDCVQLLVEGRNLSVFSSRIVREYTFISRVKSVTLFKKASWVLILMEPD